jgi:hypothetical protein
VKTCVFAPPALIGPVPFADLQAMIGKAKTALEAFIPDEVNSWAGKNLDLQIGPRRLSSVGGPNSFAFTPQLLFPRSHCIRHPTHAGCAARKARARAAQLRR